MGTRLDMSPEEITQLFIETAQKIDKCIGFELANWLQRYQEMRREPNFPEVAMLIINAANIYGRKVDYLEEIVYNIIRESEAQAEKNNKRGAENQPETGKRKRLKRYRPETLCEKFSCSEYLVKEFKCLPAASLCEKIVQRTRSDVGISFEDEFSTWTQRKDVKGPKKPPRRRLEIEEEEQCSHYTNFGESHIFDYDGEDIVGRRRDFKVFTGHIDAENQAIENDINLRKFYRLGGMPQSTVSEASILEDCTQDDSAMEDSQNLENSELVEIERGKNQSLELPDIPLAGTTLAESPTIVSDDEGIGMSQSAYISELNNIDWKIVSGEDGQIGRLEHGVTFEGMELPSSMNLKNLLNVDCSYLNYTEVFQLPDELFQRKSIIELNFLKFPEKKLRSRCLFMLPKEWIQERRDARKVEKDIPVNRRIFKLEKSLASIPTPPPTPEPVNSEDFLGFDESEIHDLSLSNSKILSSTVVHEKTSPINTQKHPRMSHDSGIQSPPPMEVMDTILEDNSSLIITSSFSESGYGSLMTSLVDEDLPEKTLTHDESLLSIPEESSSVELSEHQKTLQLVAAEEHKERVEEMKRMTDKVNRWHEYLKPILRRSQSRGHFDIHAYGTEILNMVDPAKNPQLPGSKPVSFGDILKKQKEHGLLPRYFLSMLQLINTNNISIVAQKDPRCVTHPHEVEIHFKSAERHHEELKSGLSMEKNPKRARSPSDNREKEKSCPGSSKKHKMI
ncbi:CNDH2_N domain-containing protein [Sergentomyia squamirostris]